MLVPMMRLGRMPRLSRTSSTPMCAIPCAPPPESTRATEPVDVGSAMVHAACCAGSRAASASSSAVTGSRRRPRARCISFALGRWARREWETEDMGTLISQVATVDVELRVNSASTRLTLDPRTTLLDALREHLRLTGAKKGCDHGQRGACTVHLNGRRVL